MYSLSMQGERAAVISITGTRDGVTKDGDHTCKSTHIREKKIPCAVHYALLEWCTTHSAGDRAGKGTWDLEGKSLCKPRKRFGWMDSLWIGTKPRYTCSAIPYTMGSVSLRVFAAMRPRVDQRFFVWRSTSNACFIQ